MTPPPLSCRFKTNPWISGGEGAPIFFNFTFSLPLHREAAWFYNTAKIEPLFVLKKTTTLPVPIHQGANFMVLKRRIQNTSEISQGSTASTVVGYSE